VWVPLSDVDRERVRLREEEQDRIHDEVLALDLKECRARNEKARSRDTAAGVGVVPGTGSWPPNHLPPKLAIADSIIGLGSHEDLTGEPIALTFT